MKSRIRPAVPDDVPQMVALSGQKRRQYAIDQPMFWREAGNSDAIQAPFFQAQIARRENIAMVCESDGTLQGFVIAALRAAPPVYDPGGLTCVVDDFAVADATDWVTIGNALLEAVAEEAKARGAVQMVVVCGHLDRPKGMAVARRVARYATEGFWRSDWAGGVRGRVGPTTARSRPI